MGLFDVFKSGKALRLAIEAAEKVALYEAKYKELEAQVKFILAQPVVKELVEKLKEANELLKSVKK